MTTPFAPLAEAASSRRSRHLHRTAFGAVQVSTPAGQPHRADDRPMPRTWSDLDPYLKAAHLPPGKTVPATVDRIEFQTVHPRPGQEEIKPVMYFQGKQKGLILTRTNQDFLRATFGDDITASYGKPIT